MTDVPPNGRVAIGGLDYPSSNVVAFPGTSGEFLREAVMVRIAVVDDDQLFLELIEDALGDRGWETLPIWDAVSACATLRREHPDAILLDLRMHAGCTGWDVLSLVLGDPRTADIPIIVCSAAVDELYAKRAWLESYGVMVLHKPFDIDDLYERLDVAVRHQVPELADLTGA